MKIKVSDLEANPYREMEKYPIDRVKVEAFKNSIAEKGFWENFVVRPHPTKKGKYQIAYGHHRLIAIRELNIKEVDNIPCRDLTDDQMIQIMAEENLNWETSPAIINLTVQQAKEYLEVKFKQNETWATSEETFRCLFKNQTSFQESKTKGVGRDIITKFLGKNWEEKNWFVQSALATLTAEKEGTLDRAALEIIPHIDSANVFRNSVKKYQIPKSAQKKIAKQIKEEKIGGKHIPDLVAEHSLLSAAKKKELAEPKQPPMLDDFVKGLCGMMNDLSKRLYQLKKNDGIKNIQSNRLWETFLRDGKELTKLMSEVFENEK